jgi:nitrite reductase (NO-forming)/hydroxylamine reductase
MSETDPTPNDHQNRIKKYLSADKSVAEELEFADDLDFAAGLPEPDRRSVLQAAGVAAAGALAGCQTSSEPESEPPATTEAATTTQQTTQDDSASAEQQRTVQIEAHQYEFAPQQITVEPNTELTLQFTKSTFEQDSNYSLHTFYLSEPYDVGPVELPKNTDDDVIDEVTLVADETGTFQYECTAYCGTQHASMKGELVVSEDGGAAGQQTDFTNMEDVKGTHKVVTESADLPSEPTHDLDLRDIMVVTERENASVSMVDTVNDENMGRVEDVGKAIHVHDFHPKLGENSREGAFVYTIARDGWVWKVDMFDFQRVAGFRGGTDARKVSVSSDGNYLAAGFYNPNHLVIADAETMEPVKRIPTHTVNPDGQSVGSRVCAVHDVPSQGLWAVALKEGGEVWLVDYESEDFPVVATVDTGRILHDAYFTTGDRYFWIASQEDNLMGVVDTHEQELAAELDSQAVPHPGGPFSRAEDADTAWTIHAGAAAMQFWDYEPPWDRRKVLETPGKGLFSAAHPDCSKIWGDVILSSSAADNRIVFQVDKESLEITNVIDTGEFGDWNSRSLHAEFTRDGSKVYVSLWDAGKLLVFDSETGEHLDTIGDFVTPTGTFLGRRYEEHHVEQA